MKASVRFDTQIVGALPVILSYFDKLQVAATVDKLVPWEGEVPLGTLAEILMANRLLQPKAMVHVGEWAGRVGLTDYYGLTVKELNDDRLGRALERLAEHGDTVEMALTLRAIKVFKLRVDQIHYDLTSAELFGAYEQFPAEGPESPTPMPAYGHTKSGRKNVKQIQIGLNVTQDGGVPLLHAVYSGNVAEQTTHLANLRRLSGMLKKSRFLYIADAKLDTAENLVAAAMEAGEFLCAGAFQPHLQEEFLTVRHRLRKIEYVAKSQEHLPPEERDQYQAVEITQAAEATLDGRWQRIKYRLIFIRSSALAKQHAATRERHLGKIREEFENVERNLGKYKLKSVEAVQQRLEKAKALYTEGDFFEYQVEQGRQGRLKLQGKINEKKLQRARELEGVYVLKTNLSSAKHPVAKVLGTYKEQICVERRFHHLKGPLAVTPMFLKNPERMAGLGCILVLALMVMALQERQVRKALGGKPLYGLYPEKRPSPAPTGPAIIECFSPLCVVIVKEHGTTSRRLAELTPIQQKLLRLLSIPPEAMKTFKRRCGM
jgi:transposase